jgi:hypothetical protein
MFGLFGDRQARQLKRLAEGFNSEISTLQGLSEQDAMKVLAAVGLLLKEFKQQPLFGDVRQLRGVNADKFTAAMREEVRATHRQQPYRGHALTLISMFVEAGSIADPIATQIRVKLESILLEGERVAEEHFAAHL